jgi:Ca2+-transporting ATPase
MVNALNTRSLHTSLWNLPFWGNRWLYASLTGIIFALCAIIYIPVLQGIFQTTALKAMDWMILGFIGFFLCASEEIRKYFST